MKKLKEVEKIKAILHYGLVPAVLVLSDIFLVFFGHYSGSKGGELSFSTFIHYLKNIEMGTIVPALLIAMVVMIIIAIGNKIDER